MYLVDYWTKSVYPTNGFRQRTTLSEIFKINIIKDNSKNHELLSVRKPSIYPRDGGKSWVTVSVGCTFDKNPTRKVCRLKEQLNSVSIEIHPLSLAF